ncbi:glycosyl transferase, group 1, partial [mine drainage metagenome]
IVRFRGHVEFDTLVALLAEFDALVLSSVPVAGSNWVETQATVMQEAMVMGTVVVASDIGGVRESLPTALHPYLYAPGSVQELRDRLIALGASDRRALHQLSTLARDFVLTHYDICAINERLLRHLGSVAA